MKIPIKEGIFTDTPNMFIGTCDSLASCHYYGWDSSSTSLAVVLTAPGHYNQSSGNSTAITGIVIGK